ncbi:MAG: tRNA (N6-isopentenyl adenosine(37)-C2)-methylthiotransferase MiaB [Clostridiales bacterium]|nr:tRNA (N6-isopentenyl adenosine(37)-C2)-methylthiotransferase MiaB [Clostridiales bacterium]
MDLCVKNRDTDFDRIRAAAPEKEPARQQYFIEADRAYFTAEFERALATGEALSRYGKECLENLQKNGRIGTANVVTFGCQMNARDSEKLLGILEEIGFQEWESEEADFVLYNTCTVRDNANQKVYGRLGYLRTMKRKHPRMLIGLCGCMMQESAVIEKIRKSYSHVDLIFGTHNIFKLAEILFERIAQGNMVVDIWESAKEIVEDLPIERKYPFKSGVNIMFGCNNFCSYCIVPYVRGRERSREPEEILEEIRRLAADGVIEVMLLGQNVNSYGKNLREPISFAALLRRVSEIEGIRRIRFMTSHPKDLSEELIEVMRDCDKVCAHLHLPLQSGSSRILKKMNRKYTKEDYLSLVERIRAAVPDISLTTDIIVGFPGETEEDFQETLDVIRRVRFDSAFTFQYSIRQGTPAATMEQVAEDVVKERFDRLLKEVQQIAGEVCSRHTGTVQGALVESLDDHLDGYVTGRLENNTIVHFPGDQTLIGSIVQVYLEESRGFYYMGRVADKESLEK